ncbi:MAG: DUF2232 domain-containing protein [Gammaproteobacteria bacterium]
MKQFVEWITQRAYRAGLAAAALALVPLLGIVGSGLLVLTDLRRGSGAAWSAAAVATLILLLASVAGGAQPLAAILAGLVFWAPAIGLAEVLKRSGSLSLAIQTATVASAALAVMWIVTAGGDVPEALGQQLVPLLEDAGFQQEAVTMMLTLVPGVMALTLLLAAVGGLLLGMGWHASLSSPGALGKAFRNLRLGKALAAAGLAILLGGLTTNHPLLANLLLVAMSVFVLQGLALIHAAAAARKWPGAALAVVYVLLVFGMSVMAPVLALFGMVDNWLDFRRRLESA